MYTEESSIYMQQVEYLEQTHMKIVMDSAMMCTVVMVNVYVLVESIKEH